MKYNLHELKNKGLIKKYIIKKTDKSKIHPDSEYFILRLDKYQKDPIHRKACLKALLYYAEEIAEHLPVLSRQLQMRYYPQLEKLINP